jgi:hypothetical protein
LEIQDQTESEFFGKLDLEWRAVCHEEEAVFNRTDRSGIEAGGTGDAGATAQDELPMCSPSTNSKPRFKDEERVSDSRTCFLIVSAFTPSDANNAVKSSCDGDRR